MTAYIWESAFFPLNVFGFIDTGNGCTNVEKLEPCLVSVWLKRNNVKACCFNGIKYDIKK